MQTKQPSWRSDKRSSSERGYGTAWRKVRNAYLQEHPLCVMCKADGKVAAANVVDHVVPHHGDQKLFWDESNLQALCTSHHNSDKQMFEKSGRVRAKFDAQGQVIW
jgi:5-methylcytosine-specific restriction endonuclease McrA